MKLDELRRHIALALSWQEKLQTHPEAATNASATYKDAQTVLHRLHMAVRETRKRLEKQLQETETRQAALPKRLERGEIRPQQANDQNRELQATIARLQSDIAQCRQLLEAQSTKHVGGFTNLPLEEYPKALDAVKSSPAPWQPWRKLALEDQRILLITAIVILLGVTALFYFMRWRDEVTFVIRLETASEPQVLVLECQSSEPFPIYLLMPWHEDESLETEDESYKTYQLVLQLQLDSSEDFRSLPSDDQSWHHVDRDLQYSGPVRVLPQLSEELRLELEPIRNRYPEAQNLRLQVHNARGHVVFSEAMEWPE